MRATSSRQCCCSSGSRIARGSGRVCHSRFARGDHDMHRVLLKTTIPFTEDDWHIGRFALLQGHLRSLTGADGSPLYEVDARDRVENGAGDDDDLRAAGAGAYDQVWLIGTDSTGALTQGDVDALTRF